MADSPSARTKAFISYSHADEEYRKRLRIHLQLYIREQNIDVWDDTHIDPGERWKDEIKQAIASAKVAILLVSADFLASEFIAHDELPPLLDAAKKDGLVIFSIILSASAFQKTKLANYQTFNKPSEPLISLPKDRQEEIWAKLAEKVAATLDTASPPIKESDVSPKTNKKGLNEEDEHHDTKRKQTPSAPSPQLPRSKFKGIQQNTELVGHTNGVTALALSPDIQMVVSGDEKGKVKIWDIAKRTSFTPDEVLSLGTKLWPWGLNPVTSIVFHPEGRTFLVGWRNGKIKLWKCTGEFLQSIPMWQHNWGLRTSKGVEALAIAPDGLVIIIAGQAVNYEVQGGGESQAIVNAEWSLKWREYPKTDKYIVAEDYPYIEKFGHYDCEEETPSIAFSLKGRFFAASSSTGTIRIWDIFQGKERPTLTNTAGTRDLFTSITFHPDENMLAAINAEGQCFIWDLPAGNIQKVIDPLSGKITAIAFSPSGSHLAIAHSSGALGFWSPFSEEWLKSFKAHEQSIPALVYSADGHHLVSGSLDKTIKIWEIRETDY